MFSLINLMGSKLIDVSQTSNFYTISSNIILPWTVTNVVWAYNIYLW